jgi:DNA recombination-dependent growth factor C
MLLLPLVCRQQLWNDQLQELLLLCEAQPCNCMTVAPKGHAQPTQSSSRAMRSTSPDSLAYLTDKDTSWGIAFS